MPTNPSPIHSHGTAPTFRTKDGRTVYLSNGAIVHHNGHGHETLAGSDESADWLARHVAPSAERDELIRRLGYVPRARVERRSYEARRAR